MSAAVDGVDSDLEYLELFRFGLTDAIARANVYRAVATGETAAT